MKSLDRFYQAILTENHAILNIVIILCTILEIIIEIKISKQLLDIKPNYKQRTIWFFSELISICLFKFLLLAPFYKLACAIFSAIIVTLIMKIDIIKTTTVQLAQYILIFLIESLLSKNLAITMGIGNYFSGMNVPAYRIIIVGTTIMIQFLFYLLLKKKQIIFTFPENLKRKQIATILFFYLIGFIFITAKFIDLTIHNGAFFYTLFVIDAIFIIIAFWASLKHIIQIYLTEKHRVEIEKLEQYNQNLNELYDTTRGFRHDFSNIIQALGGYITTQNLDGLKSMYNELLTECQESNMLAILNPEIINNPAIYNIISHKYQEAKNANIAMNINVWTDLQKLEIKTYEFARMLGILLDNAIEAAKKSNKKQIDVKMVVEEKNHRNVITIKNTYDNKKINIDKLFEKGYTTKNSDNKEHGLGLWEIQKILQKNDNLNLFTSIDGDFFKQQLEIYESC